VEHWRDDPVDFVKDMFGITPSSQQADMIAAAGKPGARVAVKSGHGVGKAQKVDTTVWTPDGLKKWGDIEPGSYLFGVNGKPVMVIDIPFRGFCRICKVTFDDGSFVECNEEHLWSVRGRNSRRSGSMLFETLSTKELIDRGVKRKNGAALARQWEIPAQEAVEFFEREDLPMPGYVMGLYLGNGSYGGTLYINANDLEVMLHLCDLWNTSDRKQDRTGCVVFGLRCTAVLKGLGLDCLTSERKFIPDIYKTASVEERWELLRGLLDTDGEIDHNGNVFYSSTSKTLADDVVWLVRSLGGKAHLQASVKKAFYRDSYGNKINCKDCWRVSLSMPAGYRLFYSERKAARLNSQRENRYLVRWIDSIEVTDREEECMCVAIDSEDGLYLVNDFIVTHNSSALSWLVLWGLVCYDDIKIPCTAPTAHQLSDILLAEVEKWRSKMLEPWKSSIVVNKESVNLTGSLGFAVMRTGRKENPEALQGFHADTLMFLIDEASGIDEGVYEVARGTLSTPSARIVMASNPTRPNGYFYNAFHRNRESWKLFTFNCDDSPFVAKNYVKEMKEEYGEDSDIYRVRVLGEFPKGGDLQFIPTNTVTDAAKRYYDEKAYDFAPLVLGVDVAYFGGDKSVVYLRQGLHCRCVFAVQGIEPAEFAGHIAHLWDEHQADAVFVDGTGVGAGVVSNLRLMGRKPISVAFAGASSSPTYHNKRAECWGLMRDWLKEGWIPNDDHLKDDLTGPEYSYTMTGKIILERKDDMKKRGVASPDYADALSLCFAEPILPMRKRGSVGLVSAYQSNKPAKYDPFHSLKKKRGR